MILLGGFQAQGDRKEQQDSFRLLSEKNKSFTKHAGVLAVVARLVSGSLGISGIFLQPLATGLKK